MVEKRRFVEVIILLVEARELEEEVMMVEGEGMVVEMDV